MKTLQSILLPSWLLFYLHPCSSLVHFLHTEHDEIFPSAAYGVSVKDDFHSSLPLKPPAMPRLTTPAPPWVALLAAWTGLLTLLAAVVLPFLPGSRRPRLELEGARQYGFADRYIPFPVYLSVIALFLGIIVLRQMRKEPRPLPPPMQAQRLQAWAGIVLACVGIVIIYIFVYFFIALRAVE